MNNPTNHHSTVTLLAAAGVKSLSSINGLSGRSKSAGSAIVTGLIFMEVLDDGEVVMIVVGDEGELVFVGVEGEGDSFGTAGGRFVESFVDMEEGRLIILRSL